MGGNAAVLSDARLPLIMQSLVHEPEEVVALADQTRDQRLQRIDALGWVLGLPYCGGL